MTSEAYSIAVPNRQPHMLQTSSGIGVLVPSLLLALILAGCESEPTTTATTTTSTIATIATTTTTTAPIWSEIDDLNCYQGHGATECTEFIGLDLTECKQKCIDWVDCQGFIWYGVGKQSHCDLRRDLDPKQCSNESAYKLYQVTSRVVNSSVPSPAPRESFETVVRKANELYQQVDNGVMLHVSDFDNGLISNLPQMSFSLVNKFSWEPTKGPITIWEGGCPPLVLDGRPVKPGAIIMATPTAQEETVECYYPCDGASDERVNRGCGIPLPFGTDPRDIEIVACDKSAWCDVEESKMHGYGPGHPCAFQPNRRAEALKYFNIHKSGENWPLESACHSQWLPTDSRKHWNEAVANGKKWNAGYKDYVWAFLITPCCIKEPTCFRNTLAQYNQFIDDSDNDKVPLLEFDVYDQDKPFKIYHDVAQVDV